MVDYGTINLEADGLANQDMGRIPNYKSAAKIKMSKRKGSTIVRSPAHASQTHTQMKPIKNPMWDDGG